ncbi:hypothetical protein KW797_02015 [Candidatus Parcubacteria bacterium]|nr:hypothetical protein [Candidatus Parcubacteria bacterium]
MKIKAFIFALLLVFISGYASAAQIKNLSVTYANGSYALIYPDYVLSLSLAASTAESFTVPTGPNGSKASYVSFASTCDFYANYKTTATVPGDVTDGTASALNPTVRYLKGEVTTISVITAADTCIITADFFM